MFISQRFSLLLSLSSKSIVKFMPLACVFALCCVTTAYANSSGECADDQQRIKSLNTESALGVGLNKNDTKAYVCVHNLEELQEYGLFGGRDYATSHLAIKCAIGAVAGAAVGAKFGGVLGAASGAAASCYLFTNAIPLDGLLHSLDRYIGLTPTPLDACNKYCTLQAEKGNFQHPDCKEVKNDK